jgi:hypothetical protein
MNRFCATFSLIKEQKHMRTSLAFRVAVTLAAVLISISTARAADENLAGKMAAFSYLLGGPWSCSTSVPAMGSRAAHTDQGSATFDVVPGNVVHNHVSTQEYSGDFYFGFSDRMNSYWQTDADNMGGYAFLTSADGVTYRGTASMGPVSMQDTITYAKVAPDKVTVHEVISGAAPQATFDTSCTR